MSIITCKFCAAPLPVDTLVCPHCQQRNPISPLYEQEKHLNNPDNISCVECHTNTMEFVDVGDFQESLSALKCKQCKGIFISFDLLEKSINHYGLKRKKLPKKIDAPEEKKVNKDNLYSCPICQQTMKRFLYKVSANVLIDKCETHGVWLNHGELKELIEWKQSLKNLRNKEQEEEAYQKYGLKKIKSPYTYHKDKSTKFDDFLQWLMGI